MTQFKGDNYFLRNNLEVYFAPHPASDVVHIDWIWDYLRCVSKRDERRCSQPLDGRVQSVTPSRRRARLIT